MEDITNNYEALKASGQSPAEAIKNVQSSFLEYDDSKAVMTTLYLPYLLKQYEPGMRATKAKECFFRFELNKDMVHIDLNIGTYKDAVVVPKFCKVKFGWDQLRGVNIFTDIKPPMRRYSSPRDLAEASQSSDGKARAGLYIVAASRQSLASVSSAAMISDESSQTARPSNSSDTPSSPFHKPSLKIVNRQSNMDDPGHATNAASIVCILIYPRCAEARDGKVSYYLAGDSLSEMEDTLADWINQPIACVKLSHHGSAYSSPAKLFEKYRPQAIIISAGRAHFHPGR